LQQEQQQHMLAAGLLLLDEEASNAALLRTFSPTTPAPLVLREAETPAAALISTPQLECDLNTTHQEATALSSLSSELAQPQKNRAGHKSQPCMEQEPVPTTSNSQQLPARRSRGRRSSSRRSVSGGGSGTSRKKSLALLRVAAVFLHLALCVVLCFCINK
jgi:hypothetical protein